MRRALLLALTWAATVAAAAPAPGRDAAGYRTATTPWTFRFPRDHAAHPDFRTEWWYYTGHLAAGERRFGFELTFFRVGLGRELGGGRSAWAMRDLVFAHAALTDEAGRRFLFADTLARPVLGVAGADTTRYRVWLDSWSAALAPDDRTHRLRADAGRFALALDLQPGKPPVVHGTNGVSRKSEDPAMSSHYVSLTRMPARGSVRLDGREFAVTGEAWMDHEFMSTPLDATQRGWDWFALQFEDGHELMLYRLRRGDGSIEPQSSGSWVDPAGRVRHLPLEAAEVEVRDHWSSPASGARYPSRWTVRVPGEGLEVEVEPVLADQELRTRGLAAVTYWEGSVRVRGTRRGKPVAGRGYVELTGYTGRPPGR